MNGPAKTARMSHLYGGKHAFMPAGQVFQTAFAVVIPSKYGRKGKESQAEHQ